MTAEIKRIVCIEDEPEMLDLYKLILSRRGFAVICVNGGPAGLQAIKKHQPHLVILDLMMPERDGWEVYQKLRAMDEYKELPVIVVTAKAQRIDKVLGLQIARVNAYISKPFSPQELVDSVENVLAQ